MMVVAIVLEIGVTMLVAVPTPLTVGATLRVKWPRHDAHLAAEASHHLGDDMIVTDVDDRGGDLRRQMAVAQMPGYARQQLRVAAGDLQQSLRRRLPAAPVLWPDRAGRRGRPWR